MLYDHQKTAIRNCVIKKRYALYHEQGLGKTITAILAADYVLKTNPAVTVINVVCPAFLCPNWEEEIKKWSKFAGSYRVLSYEKFTKVPKNCRFYQFLIADEAHYIKNKSSQRSKFVVDFATRTPYVILLTGTPVGNNNIIDLYTHLRCLLPRHPYASFSQFKCVFTRPHPSGFGLVAHKQDAFFDVLKDWSERKLKVDCLDLPDKIYQTVYCEGTPITQDLHVLHKMQLQDGFAVDVIDKETGTIIKTVQSRANKAEALTGLLDCIPDKEQIVIYVAFRKSIEVIKKALGNSFGKVDEFHGDLTQPQKNIVIDNFKTGRTRILIATMQSMNVGLTLTNCNNVIYYSRTFSTIERAQSEDRFHRIGQRNVVTYWDIIAKGVDAKAYIMIKQNKNIDEIRKEIANAE